MMRLLDDPLRDGAGRRWLLAGLLAAGLAGPLVSSAQTLTAARVAPSVLAPNQVASLEIELAAAGSGTPWCGLRVDLGNGSSRDLRIGDNGAADLRMRVPLQYPAAGTYLVKISGRTMARGLRSASACEGEARTVEVRVEGAAMASTAPVAPAASPSAAPVPPPMSASPSSPTATTLALGSSAPTANVPAPGGETNQRRLAELREELSRLVEEVNRLQAQGSGQPGATAPGWTPPPVDPRGPGNLPPASSLGPAGGGAPPPWPPAPTSGAPMPEPIAPSVSSAGPPPPWATTSDPPRPPGGSGSPPGPPAAPASSSWLSTLAGIVSTLGAAASAQQVAPGGMPGQMASASPSCGPNPSPECAGQALGEAIGRLREVLRRRSSNASSPPPPPSLPPPGSPGLYGGPGPASPSPYGMPPLPPPPPSMSGSPGLYGGASPGPAGPGSAGFPPPPAPPSMTLPPPGIPGPDPGRSVSAPPGGTSCRPGRELEAREYTQPEVLGKPEGRTARMCFFRNDGRSGVENLNFYPNGHFVMSSASGAGGFAMGGAVLGAARGTYGFEGDRLALRIGYAGTGVSQDTRGAGSGRQLDVSGRSRLDREMVLPNCQRITVREETRSVQPPPGNEHPAYLVIDGRRWERMGIDCPAWQGWR